MNARTEARRLRNDPEKIKRWDILLRVRAEVDRVDGQLKELAAARESEQGQLKLALAHELVRHLQLAPLQLLLLKSLRAQRLRSRLLG